MVAPDDTSDPYDPKPTLWEKHPVLAWALPVYALTVFFTVVSFPPHGTGETAYLFALPAILWAYRKPGLKAYALAVLGAQMTAWTIMLGWLHNVSWLGLLLLGPFIGLLVGAWFLAVWWAVPRLPGHPAMTRILAMLGLASLWVVSEWMRSRLFSGFPWLPLAASQWQRPLILQSASLAGAWSVGWVLILFNLGAAAYGNRIFFEGASGLRKRSPEFMVALLLLVFGSFPFLGEMMSPQRAKLAKVALVQPYIPQNQKWDERFAAEVLGTLAQVTVAANDNGAPDFIAWPEAVTPWALYRDPNMRDWIEQLARKTGKPLLLGAVGGDMPGDPPDTWRNGAFVVDPVTGLAAESYAKRKLVPFGEFVPMRPILGWLEKVVPIGGDFTPGSHAAPLQVPAGRQRLSVGVLICYEDIFPSLARDSVQSGAELLAVLTNNAWFGEGGAAYQHAAHSVLRAVETRRPVLRVGNGGWSGWIDEFGSIRATLKNDRGSVYFRGAQTVTVNRDLRWQGRETFYTRHGDWFVLACALLTFAGYYVVVTLRPPRLPKDGETVF